MPTPEDILTQTSEINTSQVTQGAKRKPTADELLQKLYAKNVPEPTFDQDKADRLQRMGKINQLGRGANVLGDVLSVALGAKVRRRQPDQVAPALYKSYQANLDKYKAEKDGNLLRNYSKDIEDLRFGIGRADREDEMAYRDRRQTAAEKQAEGKNKLDWDKYMKGLSQKERDAAEKARHNRETERINSVKANKPTAAEIAADKPFDPVQVQDKYGKNVKLVQGEWDNLYQNAMRDKEFLDGNMKAEISKFKDLPDGGVKQIARAYYDFNKQKEYKAGEKAALDKHRQEQTPAPIKQPSGKFTINGQAVTKPIF